MTVGSLWDAEGLGGIWTHLSEVCCGQHTWLYFVVLGAIFVMFVVFLTHLSKVAWLSRDIVLDCTWLFLFGGSSRYLRNTWLNFDSSVKSWWW